MIIGDALGANMGIHSSIPDKAAAQESLASMATGLQIRQEISNSTCKVQESSDALPYGRTLLCHEGFVPS